MINGLIVVFLFLYCTLECMKYERDRSPEHRKIKLKKEICQVKAVCISLVFILCLVNRFLIGDVITKSSETGASMIFYFVLLVLVGGSVYEAIQAQKQGQREETEEETHEENE